MGANYARILVAWHLTPEQFRNMDVVDKMFILNADISAGKW